MLPALSRLLLCHCLSAEGWAGPGFHRAGDLCEDPLASPEPDPEPEFFCEQAPEPVPEPIGEAISQPAPSAPASFFSRGGSLDSLDLGRHEEVVIGRGSDLGAYVNDERIDGTVELRPEDKISMADVNLLFTGSNVPYETGRFDRTGSDAPVLEAHILTKQVRHHSGVGMKELIRDIHLELREGTLVALLGTAGAGKSTVMNCLNGMELSGVQGSVFYRGVDLMRDFDRMKCMIGSVPQKKIFHPAFTPEEEFTQSAILRLPADTTDREIRDRVNKTLEMLSMTGVRKSRNSTLSGGEQTRVNVGIELVADRDLLCLDEPDQGLSPNYKHELFEILRSLAHDYGKTVLTIIHDVSEIDLFDQVIILAKKDGVGRLAFSGSPTDAREHFGVDIRDVYALLEREPERFVKD